MTSCACVPPLPCSVKGWLFKTALASKVAGLRQGHLTHGLWDRLVFGPLKKRIGFDRLRMMITGSAPIGGNVLDFLRAVFGVPVHEGGPMFLYFCPSVPLSAHTFPFVCLCLPAAR